MANSESWYPTYDAPKIRTFQPGEINIFRSARSYPNLPGLLKRTTTTVGVRRDWETNNPSGGRTMVDQRVIESWKMAPRLTSFAEFFERTASGVSGAPDIARPMVDLGLLDSDLDCAVFADTHRNFWGTFDGHYFASIPYRLEEECRLGAAILSFGLRRWARRAHAATLYTLGAGTGCMARTVAAMAGGRIKSLNCSPTGANRTTFHANRGSDHAHFFHGPFFELDSKRLSDDPGLAPFRDGFDVLLEDTTFQMYSPDRTNQLAFVAPQVRPGGILIQVAKMSRADRQTYELRERQKDEMFKSRYFSARQISEKKDEILGTMEDCQVDLQTTISALSLFFRYSVLTWNSGNFYTIVSSNTRGAVLEFVSFMVKPAIPPAYCYELLPQVTTDTASDPISPHLSWRPAVTACLDMFPHSMAS